MSRGRERFGRGIILGQDLVAALARRGVCRSREVVRLASLALDAPRPVPLDTGRYLDGPGKPGRATVWAPQAFWARVEGRARRSGESVSEALRALVYGGLAMEEDDACAP